MRTCEFRGGLYRIETIIVFFHLGKLSHVTYIFLINSCICNSNVSLRIRIDAQGAFGLARFARQPSASTRSGANERQRRCKNYEMRHARLPDRAENQAPFCVHSTDGAHNAYSTVARVPAYPFSNRIIIFYLLRARARARFSRLHEIAHTVGTACELPRRVCVRARTSHTRGTNNGQSEFLQSPGVANRLFRLRSEREPARTRLVSSGFATQSNPDRTARSAAFSVIGEGGRWQFSRIEIMKKSWEEW